MVSVYVNLLYVYIKAKIGGKNRYPFIIRLVNKYTVWLEMQLLPRYKIQYISQEVQAVVWYCVVVENEDENDYFFICKTLYEITPLISITSIEFLSTRKRTLSYLPVVFTPQTIRSPDVGIQHS